MEPGHFIEECSRLIDSRPMPTQWRPGARHIESGKVGVGKNTADSGVGLFVVEEQWTRGGPGLSHKDKQKCFGGN